MLPLGLGMGKILCGSHWMADVLYDIAAPVEDIRTGETRALETRASDTANVVAPGSPGYVVRLNTVKGTLGRIRDCQDPSLILLDGSTHALSFGGHKRKYASYFAVLMIHDEEVTH